MEGVISEDRQLQNHLGVITQVPVSRGVHFFQFVVHRYQDLQWCGVVSDDKLAGRIGILGAAWAHFFIFLPGTAPWSGLDPSQRLRNGSGMLVDQVSGQTIDSRPISGQI